MSRRKKSGEGSYRTASQPLGLVPRRDHILQLHGDPEQHVELAWLQSRAVKAGSCARRSAASKNLLSTTVSKLAKSKRSWTYC
jgi:hypothetical protein